MGTLQLKYVVQDVDRHGNVRTYVRLPRRPKIRIRAMPGTIEFTIAYDAALATKPGEASAPAGSFKALCEAYYASKVYDALDASTQSWRRRALDAICVDRGTNPHALLRPKHICRIRDEMADRPVVANQRLKALKALFKWALSNGEADHNPAREVDLLSVFTDGHHTWTVEEIEQYEEKHAVGTRARLAMELLFYTAGRREDAVRLGRQHIYLKRWTDDDGEHEQRRIKFVQAKNEHRKRVTVDVPLHDELAAAIEACDSKHLTFLVTEFGKPFTPNGFGNWFADRCIEAGVPGRAHGLRKAILTHLANRNASGHELMSVGGHQSLEQVDGYTRKANRARLADSAFAKL